MEMDHAQHAVLPRRAIVILLDSLNRHMLGALRRRRVRDAEPRPLRGARRCASTSTTPARCRACRRATTSSAARSTSCGGRGARSRCGSTRSPRYLRDAGVTTMLVSDHPHLFEIGRRELPHRLHGVGLPARPRERPVEDAARPDLDRRAGARPRPRMPVRRLARLLPRRGATSRARARWRRPRAGSTTTPAHHDRFLLFVDEFDPHEPFDTPEPYASMYDPDWEGPHLIWPPYAHGARRARACSTSAQARQVRACYGAKLTMIDHWFGRVLDALDRNGALGRHRGHRLHRPRPLPRREGHLGQAGGAGLRAARPHPAAGRLARASAPARRRRAHDDRRPLRHARRRLRRAAAQHRTHGRSLVPLLARRGDAGARLGARRRLGPRGARHRRHDASTRARPVGDNVPLSMWSNRWSTMPVHVAARAAAAAARRPRRARPHAGLATCP